jgi:hypothetical protein
MLYPQHFIDDLKDRADFVRITGSTFKKVIEHNFVGTQIVPLVGDIIPILGE